MTRPPLRNVVALSRGLERVLGLPTIPELGLPTTRKMREQILGCLTWCPGSVADTAGLNKKALFEGSTEV